jgi:hypothetical protein
MSKNAIANSVPSRRAILAAGPAAVLSTVGKAKAETFPAAADPIFAAIDAARRARAAYDEARAPSRAVFREHPELRPCFTFVAKADGDSGKVSTINELNDWLDRQGPAYSVSCKRACAESVARIFGIEVPAVADPSPEALAAWEAERAAVVAEFERARRPYDDAEAKAFPAHLRAVVDKAADASQAAAEALLATVPNTPAGGAALLRYCFEAMDRYGDYVEVLPAMENALAAIEGSLVAKIPTSA